jgi:hypothetical protein
MIGTVCRKMLLTAICVVLFCGGASAAQRTVMLEGPASVFKGKPVYSDGEFVGLVGDYLLLAFGSHRLEISPNEGPDLSLTLELDEKGVRIVKSGLADACYSGPAWTLASWSPSVQSQSILPDVAVVQLGTPDLRKDPKLQTLCEPSMASCHWKYIPLRVESTPSGAEIWVDGKKINENTNIDLSLAYCDWERNKHLLLRLPGRVNCERAIDLAAKPAAISCDLSLPPN